MAVYRQGVVYRAELGRMPLRVGDAILLHGTWKRLELLHDESSLLFTTPLDKDQLRPEKALFAGLWLAVALVMVIVFKIQLSVCLMTGALGMILTRVLSIDEAYQAVDWRTVFLLGGLIPLGIATEKTGAAAWIAQDGAKHHRHGRAHRAPGRDRGFVHRVHPGHQQRGRHGASGAAGGEHGPGPPTPTRAWRLWWWGLATSNSFILPTHQVNALYMGPGRYRSVDFLKAGTVVSIIFLVVMTAMLYLFY